MNVIVVDNERQLREVLEDKLRKIERINDVTTFANPFEALEYTSKNPVDIAFLDIEMPELNGIEMAKQLKSIKPEMNIVFVTGYSQYAVDAFGTDASDFLLKPVSVERIEEALGRLRNPVLPSISRIRIQTFGKFEIFVDDKPVSFGRTRSKEILAYLIDRKGAGVSKKELSAVLWEDGDHSRRRQLDLQIYVAEMMKALKAVDAGHIIIKGHDSLSVDRTQFDCDYYRYLAGESRAFNVYMGEYMVNYSWAEFTNAALQTIR